MRSNAFKKAAKKVLSDVGSTGLLLSLAISFLLAVFAPLDLFITNRKEFWFNLSEMLSFVIPVFLVLFLGNMLILLAVRAFSRTAFRGLVILEFMVLLVLYIQGNYLAYNLPGITGGKIDWSGYTKDTIISLILVAVVFIGLMVLLFKAHIGVMETVIRLVSAGLLLMLVVTLVVEVLSHDIKDNVTFMVTDNDILTMSTDQNFVILLLDHTDAGLTMDLLNSDPKYSKYFEDFTFYPNTMGMYKDTKMSIPFILTGQRYLYQDTYDNFYNDAFLESPLINGLKDRNFRMGLYEMQFLKVKDESIFDVENISDAKLVVSSRKGFRQAWKNLIGYRYAPYFMKDSFPVTLDDFNVLRKSSSVETVYYWGNLEFYNRLNEQEIELTDDKCFRYIHLMGDHDPYILNEKMEKIDGTIEEQLQACMTMLDTYITRLKEAGVYDNTTIVIMGDHGRRRGNFLDEGTRLRRDEEGHRVGNWGQNPIFMIKGVGEKHEFEICQDPISYDDLQQGFTALMDGAKSLEAFHWDDEERERKFYFIEWQKLGIDPFIVYSHVGHASDLDAFEETGEVYEPTPESAGGK